MLPSKGKLLFDSLKPSFILSNLRLSTLPQSATSSTESSPLPLQKPKKESFMKNVFLGKFPDDFLAFSVNKKIDGSDKLQELTRSYEEYCEHHGNKGINCKNHFTFLNEKGFLALASPQTHNEETVTYSELIKFYEGLNLNFNLAVLLELHSSLIIPAIVKFGSNHQKELYLNRLRKGEITGGYALCEENNGSDPSAINSIATEVSEQYLINGEKYWVTNALNADFFIVFAHVPISNLLKNGQEFVKDLSVFLVDKSEKLQIKEHDLIGLKGCDVGSVTFREHCISKNNLLSELGNGYKIATEGLTNYKFIIITTILSCLKRLTKSTTTYINRRKQFPLDLKDCELVQKKIADIACVIYSLESMLYFTCNLLDEYDIDMSLESVLLQIYGFEKGVQALVECLGLLGSKSYDRNYEYEELLRDINGVKLFAYSPDIAKLYSSLIGLSHTGNILNKVIKKNRNPFNYPMYIFGKMMKNRRIANGNPKLTLRLYMNLHPSLKVSADQLEECVICFNFIVELLLTRHGSEIVNRQVELKRISEIALDLFTMTSVLSRASHSYCSGIQNCDQEVLLAKSICFNLFCQVKRNIDKVIYTDNSLDESVLLGIGTSFLKSQSYFIENPHKTCF